jgi:APA family basic amino acid/polyamine antiporter
VSERTEELNRSLGLYDSTMIVAGSMIGSGIFIVAAEMSREIGSAGWLLFSWLITGLLTLAAALSYGELAAMMPHAGGQYVYLREAWSPLWGFLYGWTLFLVIQTGTIAAVGVGFARYFGILWPVLSESNYIIPPIHVLPGYALSLSTAQLVAILLILLLTWSNARGINYGKIVQNIFTTAKIGGLIGIVVIGVFVGRNAAAVSANFTNMWKPQAGGPETAFALFIAICVSQSGSLFSADAWNNITFTAGEVKNPRRNVPLSLAFGTLIVIGLYLLANLAYVLVLPLDQVQHAKSDRVAAAMLEAVFPMVGAALMAGVIMVSGFGCVNGMVLSGARAYYAMAKDGLFFPPAARLNKGRVPGHSLWMQGAWASALVLPRTYNQATNTYGNLYSDLLDYVVSAALFFYILTIAGVIRLRSTQPDVERPYRAFGYPVVPILYIAGAATILAALFIYRPAATYPGVVIVLIGLPVFRVFRSIGSPVQNP